MILSVRGHINGKAPNMTRMGKWFESGSARPCGRGGTKLQVVPALPGYVGPFSADAPGARTRQPRRFVVRCPQWPSFSRGRSQAHKNPLIRLKDFPERAEPP